MRRAGHGFLGDKLKNWMRRFGGSVHDHFDPSVGGWWEVVCWEQE